MFIFDLLNLFRISSFEFSVLFVLGGHGALDCGARGASLKSKGVF